MITVLKQIKNHDKIESLQIMLEVIEVLEKNYNADYSLSIKEWNTVTKWLEKYYYEIKELIIKEERRVLNEHKIH